MSNMDEGQRKQYETQLQTEEYQNLQTQLQELNQKNHELSVSFEAQNFFLQNGVPANQLVLNQGYDVMVNSGWQYLLGEINRLKTTSTQQTQTKPRKSAPNVVTDKASAGAGQPCARASECRTQTLWARLCQHFNELLFSITLDDVAQVRIDLPATTALAKHAL